MIIFGLLLKAGYLHGFTLRFYPPILYTGILPAQACMMMIFGFPLWSQTHVVHFKSGITLCLGDPNTLYHNLLLLG